ncbi:D(2) dopamine receptor-like [Saccoglossus kowalevskii]|uniref:D(2)-like dopamine receptor-like n=1 Tax=Saccoglossus kowalevskii TaxID=10224 RepID=A0ABM0GJA4_SACKO|nr:PREDICTED: D(2)-like dopamine receptor-like [Saccoglossus kowalevskii]
MATERQLLLRNNSSDIISPTAENVHQPDYYNYWSLFIILFSLVTVFGNVLVCLAVFREKSLRNITNYFIVSLAVADLSVGLLVMPVAIYVEINGGFWYLGHTLCDFWVTMDVMSCTASIFNLCAISLDRLYAVSKPLQYARQRSTQRALVTIAIVWMISFIISCPVLFGVNNVPNRVPELCILFNGPYMVWSSVFSFVIPAFIMSIVYILVYVAIKNRVTRIGIGGTTMAKHNRTEVSDLPQSDEPTQDTVHEPDPTGQIQNNTDGTGGNATLQRPQNALGRQHSRSTFPNVKPNKFSMRRERKATKTLAIVLGVFLICWIPFFTLNILFGVCPTCTAPHTSSRALFLGYINSTMNPIIYTVFNNEFRRAFKKIILCSKS